MTKSYSFFRGIISPNHMATFFYFSMVVVTACFPDMLHASDTLVKAGWIEQARIYPGNLLIDAKLDTGAKSTSIHAENITRFKRDGKPWVRFTVKSRNSKQATLEREIHRTVKIKRHTLKPAERPVIFLGICVGETYKKTEVNLANRSNYNYDLLIGREFLDEHFTIDPSSKRLLRPNCTDSLSK